MISGKFHFFHFAAKRSRRKSKRTLVSLKVDNLLGKISCSNFVAFDFGFWSKQPMPEALAPVSPEPDNALYAGALATAVVGLLPYVNVFIVPAYVVGALVAVRYATMARGRSLLFKDAAQLGFLSTFLGTLCAAVLVDLIWLFFDYQLWQRQNSDLMLAIFRSFAGPVTIDAMRDAFAQQAVKPFQWYIFIVQVIVNAIFCGIFGTLGGIIAVKIFHPRSA